MAIVRFKTDIWCVHMVESERGWGQKPFGEKYFDNEKEAEAFYLKFNAENKSNTVPDWYAYAKAPVKVVRKDDLYK